MLSRTPRISQLLLAAATTFFATFASFDVAYAQWSAGITGSRPNLGEVASAASGDTVFQVSTSGAISKISGVGARVSSGSSQVTVTVACGSQGFCNNDPLDVTVTATGSPTGRAEAMTAFTVAAGTGSISNVSGSGTGALTFTLGPIGKNSSKTFHLGMNFPIAGDDSGLATGSAQSQFLVSIEPPGNTPPINVVGTGIATVFRSLSLAKTSDLTFGRVVKPASGSGTVTITALTGLRTLSGSVVGLPTPSPSRASYTVTGEGGQTLSITVPTTFNLTGPGTIAVTTNKTVFGSPTLSAILGLQGTYQFHVGGSFTVDSNTPSGAYSGTFVVSVAYN